jgi:SWI/SNF-related matrix-associated actin-dependent regulator of chromatin subfamily A member 5
MKVGGSKPDKPKVPRPPKQVHINDFQFYPPRLMILQDREYDAHRVSILKRSADSADWS